MKLLLRFPITKILLDLTGTKQILKIVSAVVTAEPASGKKCSINPQRDLPLARRS
jgi:hypothetical protein